MSTKSIYPHRFIRLCTVVYLLLMGLTLLTWLVGLYGINGLAVVFSVLGVSLLKANLVGDYFMGLKWVSGGWRLVILVWLAVLGSLLATAFYIAR